MVKLNAPLFSGAATGSLGKQLWLSRHHGINVAGKKATPTDPETQEQLDQRAAMTAAAAEWKALDLLPIDRMAWNTLALLRKLNIGPYAMFVKHFIPLYNQAIPWVRFRNMRIIYIGATSLTFRIEARNYILPLWAIRTGSRLQGDVYVQMTPIGGNDFEAHFNGLQRNMKFYFHAYCYHRDTRIGQSGYYYTKTSFL